MVVAGPDLHQQDVVGLEIAVHHLAVVHHLEGLPHLHHQLHGEGHRQALMAAEEVREGDPGAELHDRVGQALVLPIVVEGDEVGVDEAAAGQGLILEARQDLRISGEALVEHLDGHRLTQPDVGALIHRAHASSADAALYPVAAAEGGPEEGIHGVLIPWAREPAAATIQGAGLELEIAARTLHQAGMVRRPEGKAKIQGKVRAAGVNSSSHKAAGLRCLSADPPDARRMIVLITRPGCASAKAA